MTVEDAREIARQWVLEEAQNLPGFSGAFCHGSINWLSIDAVLPETSDVDVMVVFMPPDHPDKIGKFRYRGILLEVSCLSCDQIESPEQVLGNYHLAGSFRAPGILSDPHGRLAELQAAVSRDYAKRGWVRKRCEHAESNIRRYIDSLDEAAPFHEQVTSWLFAAGVTTHILLVAGLKNPTVRRRYVAVKELLEEYQLLPFHETLLEMLGCEQMTRKQAERHLAALTEAFDSAGAVLKTPYPFAADMSEAGRPVAIDGSRELIESGWHREAIFWMTAVYSRCQHVLRLDASMEMQERFSRDYRSLLADLSIDSFPDLQRRSDQVRERLPAIRAVAETIMAANPEIDNGPVTVPVEDPTQRVRGNT